MSDWYEEYKKKLSKLFNIYDNRMYEYKAKIMVMNGQNESIRYLIDMLTRKCIQETQSATTYESLCTQVDPIISAILFVIGGGSPHYDFQDEYPNKKVDITDLEYLQEEMNIQNVFAELSNIQSSLGMVVGAKVMQASHILGVKPDEPLDSVKRVLIVIFKDVQAMTMQKLQRVELPESQR